MRLCPTTITTVAQAIKTGPIRAMLLLRRFSPSRCLRNMSMKLNELCGDSFKATAGITTSKLRGFLALMTKIYNEENLRTEKTISAASQAKLLRLRVRIVYDAGREPTVKAFVEKSLSIAI